MEIVNDDDNQRGSTNENPKTYEEINRNIETVQEIKNANITIVKHNAETDCYMNNYGSSSVEYEKNKSEQIVRFSKLKLENRDLNDNLQQEIRNREKVKLEIDSMKRNVEKYKNQLNLLKRKTENNNLHKIKTVEWLKTFDQISHYKEEESQKLCAYTDQINQAQITFNEDEEYYAKFMAKSQEILDELKAEFRISEVSEHELIERIEIIAVNSDSQNTKLQEELSHKEELTKELNKLQESFNLAITDFETVKTNSQIEISNLESIISADTEREKSLKCNWEDLHKENEEQNKLIAEMSSVAKILEDEIFEQEEVNTNLNQLKLEHELKLASYKIKCNKNLEDLNAKLESSNCTLNKTEHYKKQLKQVRSLSFYFLQIIAM